MKTRTWVKLPLLLAPLLISCADDSRGHLVLAFQTDVSLPKDIDFVKVQVTYADNEAKVPYLRTFKKLGNPDGELRLPATVAFLPPESSRQQLRIRVIAGREFDEFPAFHREIVTTVPTSRTALLSVPIEFLCNGVAEPALDQRDNIQRDDNGIVITKSTCPEGLTCKAGRCEPAEIPPESLPDFDEGDVFGGGTSRGDGSCFDTATCFTESKPVVVHVDASTGKCIGTLSEGTADGVNIGIRTQGGGMCNSKDCFVALDFDREGGWKLSDSPNTIELPISVCERVDGEKTIAGVVAAPVMDGSCAKKSVSLPTCGPWSVSGSKNQSSPDPNAPTYIALGQVNPVALSLTETDIYWTAKGALAADGTSDGRGAVKMVSKNGGEPSYVAENQYAPSGLTLDEGRFFVFWTNEQGAMGTGGDIRWTPLGQPLKPSEGNILVSNTNLLQPAGIALLSSPWQVFFTDVGSSKVYGAGISADGSALTLTGAPVLVPPSTPAPSSPRNIAAKQSTVCWTYESTLNDGQGVVACNDGSSTEAIATQQSTPRAIAMRIDGAQNLVVYWANFADTGMGSIKRVKLTGAPYTVDTIANIASPAGLAIDESSNRLYVTSRGEKRIVWIPLDAPDVSMGAVEPRLVVGNRNTPGAITFDDEFVYWIEEGEKPNTPTGAILKIKKPL